MFALNRLISCIGSRGLRDAILSLVRTVIAIVLCGSGAAFAQPAVASKIAADLQEILRSPATPKRSWTEELAGRRYVKALIVSSSTDPDLAELRANVLALGGSVYYRYLSVPALLSKPWDDDVLLSVLHDGLERKRLARERDLLLALTREQNAQLQAHAEHLEEKVRGRTADLQKASDDVKAAHARISTDFQGTVKMLATLLEKRPGLSDGRSRRVAEQVKQLGPRVGLAGAELQDAIYAALLEDLGKLTFPELWLTTPLHMLRHAIASSS